MRAIHVDRYQAESALDGERDPFGAVGRWLAYKFAVRGLGFGRRREVFHEAHRNGFRNGDYQI
jgi:hypothetical protein